MEQSTGGAHFLKKHGPQVLKTQLLERSITGFFNGVQGRPNNSSSYNSYRDMLNVSLKAQSQMKISGNHIIRTSLDGRISIKIESGGIIGGGYFKGGGNYIQSNTSIVNFGIGGTSGLISPYTFFPSLSKGDF